MGIKVLRLGFGTTLDEDPFTDDSVPFPSTRTQGSPYDP